MNATTIQPRLTLAQRSAIIRLTAEQAAANLTPKTPIDPAWLDDRDYERMIILAGEDN